VLIDELQHQLLGPLWQFRIPVAPTGVARQETDISIPELSLGGPVRSGQRRRVRAEVPTSYGRTAVQAEAHQLHTLIRDFPSHVDSLVVADPRFRRGVVGPRPFAECALASQERIVQFIQLLQHPISQAGCHHARKPLPAQAVIAMTIAKEWETERGAVVIAE
jgi:hypothetical protein